MDNETTGRKRGYWEWIPVLLAMLLSFSCVFTATAMALMAQPDKLDDASMLPVGTANYGQIDSDKERFAQLDEAIFADATQDSAGLHVTPGSSGEVSGNRKEPIFLAFVTPSSSETPVPSPMVVTMDAPGTAVPRPIASSTPATSTQPTRTPKVTATSIRTRFATVTLTPRASVTPRVTLTPYPTPSLTNTPVSPQPTATSKPSNPPAPTHTSTATTAVTPTATQTNLPPHATNTSTTTATNTATATAINTATSTATHTATAVPPTATNTATATHTATAVPPTATNTATSTATAVPPTATNTATATPEVPSVLSIALVNTDTNQIIPGYETMSDGITLDLTLLPTENLNMWVTLDPQYVDSVDVELTGAASRSHTEYIYPYSFPGNSGFNFWGYNFVLGDYTLTFQPYAIDGTVGIPFVFNFTVIRSTVQEVDLIECVIDNNNGNYTAVFGYNNPNGQEINIPVGPNNRFIPDPINRGQPEYFHPGPPIYGVISVEFAGGSTIAWFLDGNITTARSSSPPCSP